MATYRLEPPTELQTPAGFGRLFWRYPIPRGYTLLVTGSTVVKEFSPAVQDTIAADYCYLGGHIYEISETEKTILTNAGYGAYITPL